MRSAPNHVTVEPGPRHRSTFERLCRSANARGDLVPDAYLAAMAIERGAILYSADRGLARFSELHFRHPLDGGPVDRARRERD